MRPPAYSDDFCTLYIGTALDILRGMPDRSVHMAVTSPPYWGLRSYLPKDHPAKGQEIGTEKTPDEYVTKLVEVFSEVWRVLRDDGTLWVNIGDSYATTPTGNRGRKSNLAGADSTTYGKTLDKYTEAKTNRAPIPPGLKPKDLCLIPARLAIALQADGWYLRQELVWAKDSCMPESVRDRCTRSHEFIYMLTKKPRYFYDSEAIKETSVATHGSGNGFKRDARLSYRDENGARGSEETWNPVEGGTRNARSVWRINPKPYPGSHFATFPPELPMRCIKAGTSERGVCSECGAPWGRVVERGDLVASGPNGLAVKGRSSNRHTYDNALADRPADGWGDLPKREERTVGWELTCAHEARTEPATVLDPFCGSGTTLYAARKLGRRSVGIDLDEGSLEHLEERLGNQGVLL